MDEHLVRQAKNGSKEALAQLLYSNYEIVYKFLIKFTLNITMAEDLSQETMVRAIEKFDLYDHARSKFSTWLISIARNIYIDWLRKGKHERVGEEGGLLEALASVEDSIGGIDSDLMHNTIDALSKLQDEIRLPLLLKHYYGYTYEEIAGMMGIPVGTVKSRIHNGLKLLRKELEKDE